jgi:hypothetical protein
MLRKAEVEDQIGRRIGAESSPTSALSVTCERLKPRHFSTGPNEKQARIKSEAGKTHRSTEAQSTVKPLPSQVYTVLLTRPGGKGRHQPSLVSNLEERLTGFIDKALSWSGLCRVWSGLVWSGPLSGSALCFSLYSQTLFGNNPSLPHFAP